MDILKRHTLVLNRNWTPISTVTVQDAITMLFGGLYDSKGHKIPKAQIIDVKFNLDDTLQSCLVYTWDEWAKLPIGENEPLLHAGGDKKFRVPEIIIATRFQQVPKNQLSFTKSKLLRRDENTCLYCGKKDANSIDHIIPKSKGGKNSWENCVACCFECNQKKKDQTLEEANMKLLKKPCKPGLEIIGQNKIKMKSWQFFLK